MATRLTRVQARAPRDIGSSALHSLNVVMACALVGLLALATLPSATAATTAVESRRDGNVVHIQARALLEADLATAWRVLTDYERYVEFIPDLRVSRVLSRMNSKVTVAQSGDARWFISWPLDITFEIVESPPDRLRSRAIAGSLQSLVSSYQLTPEGKGTRLEYNGDIEAGFALLGRLEQTAVERNVARQFKALADEIERQAAHGDARQDRRREGGG